MEPIGALFDRAFTEYREELERLRHRVADLEQKLETVAAGPELPITKAEFLARHPGFTKGSLDWLLFHREKNGLTSAIVDRGPKLLIYEQRFFELYSRLPQAKRTAARIKRARGSASR